MDKMGLEKTSPMALATLGLVLAAMGAAGVMLWQTQTIVGEDWPCAS
jgi:P pilus assembly chaperone PapD